MSTYSDPAANAAAITPDNSNDLPGGISRALWVGGAGDLSIDFATGTTVTIVGVATGTLLPFRVRRVRTASTATSLVALY